MIKIEKNIPIPTFKKTLKYPFEEMQVGDSFFVKDVKRNNLSITARKYGSKTGRKFLVREVEGGVRCWRVE